MVFNYLNSIIGFKKIAFITIKKTFYLNFLFISSSSLINAAIGFLFYLIAARYYTKDELGIFIGIISIINIVLLMTRFGLDQSIIRFLPQKYPNSIDLTSILVTTASSAFFMVIILSNIELVSQQLSIVRTHWIVYIILTVINSFFLQLGASLLAMRKGNYYFILNNILILKLIFLIIFSSFGVLGLIFSYMVPYLFSVIIGIIIINSKFKIIFNLKFLKNFFLFSFENYLIAMFMAIPPLLIPIFILNKMGPESTTHYYISYAIVSLLFSITASLASSLYIEGCNRKSIRSPLIACIKITYIFLVISITSLYVIGDRIFIIIASDYIEILSLLKIMSISSFFAVGYQIYFTIKRIEGDIKGITILSLMMSAIIISSSYILMNIYGLIGIGYAWILTYGFSNIIIIYLYKEKIKRLGIRSRNLDK